eukprot:m.201590 g.201590  ORF g.201590 m.201590 type:complete len:415 (+) comp15347_c0_seq1:276-1520(+)
MAGRKPGTSSFQRRGGRALPLGTVPSRQNAQLLVSTGVQSLDALLGGGVAVGATVLLQEDTHKMYSRTVLKLFLSEGLACGHALGLASADRDPAGVMRTLYPEADRTDRKGSTTTTSAAPAGTAARPLAATVGQAGPAASATTSQPPKAGGSESLSIAWRYRNVNQVSTEIGTSGGLGRDFDVSKSVPPENIAAANVLTVDVRTVSREADGVDATLDSPSALLPPHAAVLAEVTAWLAPFAVQRPTAPSEQRTVARVVVESLGSPLWSADGEELVSTIRLLHRLRALARQAFAVLLVTVPGEIVAPDPLRRCVHLSDAAVGLEAFAGTPNEHSPLLKEYHGFVHVLKLPRLNTLTPYYPDTLDLAFKLRRKKFVIERIHLPPDLSETVSRTQGAAPKHAAAAAAGGAAAAATDW